MNNWRDCSVHMWYSVWWDNLLISTLYSVIQVDDPIECILIVQVKVMDISRQAGSESNGQFRLKVTNLRTNGYAQTT
jgi:hypothetical protein